MSKRQKFRARDKVTQKLTRDGLTLRNAATGEENRVSKRSADFDLRGENAAETLLQIETRRGSRTDKHKRRTSYKRAQTQNRQTSYAAETEQSARLQFTAAETAKTKEADGAANEAAKQDVIQRNAEQSHDSGNSEQSHHEEHIPPQNNHGLSKRPPSSKPKPPPDRWVQYRFNEERQTDGGNAAGSQNIVPAGQNPSPVTENAPSHQQSPPVYSADAPESRLKLEKSERLRFNRDEPEETRQDKEKYKPRAPDTLPITGEHDAIFGVQPEFDENDSVFEVPHDGEAEASHGDPTLYENKSSKLNFEPEEPAVPQTGKPKCYQKTDEAVKPESETVTRDTSTEAKTIYDSADDTGETAAHPKETSGEPLRHEKSETPLNTDKSESPLKADRKSKLQFVSDETVAVSPVPTAATKITRNPKLNKAQTQADKAAAKLETAKAKLPSKKKLRSERIFNEETGKPKHRLYFENEVKPQGEHLKGAPPFRLVKAAGNTALAFGHRKMFQVERENTATEAAHKGEMAAEAIVRSALRHHKLAPYRKAAKLERKAAKKSINLAYQKALAENPGRMGEQFAQRTTSPKLQSNILSRAFQKRKIKKNYAKAARETRKAAQRAKKTGSIIGGAAKAIGGAVMRHPAVMAVIVLIALLLFMLMALFGAFGSMGSGGFGGILQASYLADDADINNAELAYTERETDLLIEIADVENTHGGYDEYRYNVGDISHNPYELMAYLTVKYQNFTYAAIEADLRTLFDEQYSLTFTPSSETRYADVDDSNDDGDYEPYEWNVLTVTLAARSFTDVAVSHLSGEEAVHYALLLQTKGGRQYLSNPFGDMNWLPYVSSYYGYRIHPGRMGEQDAERPTSPIDGGKNYHKGADIALPQGTEILSGQDGTVTFAGYSGDYGNVVVIEDDKGLVSKYAHCDSLLVSAWQEVKAGDAIATVGNTGASTGPHLHLEIIKDDQYLDPLYFAYCGSFSAMPEYGDPGVPMGDGTYAAMMEIALRFEGWRYVWGGSSPETSFDCSGLLYYVINRSGAGSIGRTTAYGIYNLCTPISPEEAKPGDLVFFHSTYSTTSPITHIGIYCGGNLMYDAGDPIGYTRLDTSYWQTHFYGFARLP